MATATAPRKRMQTQHGPRSLDIESREKVREARDTILAVPLPGEIILFSPVFPYLRYGPGSGMETSDEVIVFGPEPHVAKVRRDHPLLVDGTNSNGSLRPGLFRAHPEIETVERESERRYYACDVCEREFPAKGVLVHHHKTAHAVSDGGKLDTVGRPLAKATMKAKPRPEDEPDDDGAVEDDEPEVDEGEPEE